MEEHVVRRAPMKEAHPQGRSSRDQRRMREIDGTARMQAAEENLDGGSGGDDELDEAQSLEPSEMRQKQQSCDALATGAGECNMSSTNRAMGWQQAIPSLQPLRTSRLRATRPADGSLPCRPRPTWTSNHACPWPARHSTFSEWYSCSDTASVGESRRLFH